MLGELRMASLLAGVRGEPPVDRTALAGVVAALSRLGAEMPELAEIEINPLVAGPDGAVAIDARARLGR
jgi:succinyl-CoA synthetase beta subunit